MFRPSACNLWVYFCRNGVMWTTISSQGSCHLCRLQVRKEVSLLPTHRRFRCVTPSPIFFHGRPLVVTIRTRVPIYGSLCRQKSVTSHHRGLHPTTCDELRRPADTKPDDDYVLPQRVEFKLASHLGRLSLLPSVG